MPLPAHVSDFVDCWTKKRKRYSLARLDDCFDRFFTSFVIYNFLYGWITQSKGYKLSQERMMATKVPKKFLGSAQLHRNKELHRATSIIACQLAKRQFTLKSREADQKILQKLNSNDPEQWSVGMMEAVYQVRCNTFHGEKGFESRQKDILLPCIRIIETVSMLLIEKESGQKSSKSKV